MEFQLYHQSYQRTPKTDLLYNGLVVSLQSKGLRVFSKPCSKASILQCSAFFTVQLSHPYMTTGKTVALTTLTFVGKVMSLLLNMLSRLVINLLPRSKRLLISWLQSPSAVILESPKIKSDTVSTNQCQILKRQCNRPDHRVSITVPFSRWDQVEDRYKSLSDSNKVVNPNHRELICQSQGLFIICSSGGRSCGKGKTELWP